MRTYGTLYYNNGKWVLDNIEPHVAIKLKALFPKIPRASPCPFSLDYRPEISHDLEWFVQRYPLAISESDQKLLLQQKSQRLAKIDELEKLMRPDYTPSFIQLKKPLRTYQAQAVDIQRASKALLIGDDIGLGKTAIAIGTFAFQDMMPAAVVVQTHLPKQWRDEIYKFMDPVVHTIRGTKPYSLPPADIYIFKYSQLAGWVDTFKMGVFKSVKFDEIQELRRDDSNKYSAARELCRNVEYVLGLSATPIYNYAIEIYNILDLMKEGCLGNRADFLREWTAGWNEIKDPRALGTYLREQHLFLRRTRKEVGRELPAVNTIVHTVDYDEEAIEKIENLARMLAIKVTTGSFVERGKAARDLDMMVRQATGISKAKYVAQYVKMLLDNGESVLLAGWHRAVYDIWNEELKAYHPVMYTGSETEAQKEKSKQAFINGDSPLMFISLRSGVGLDGIQARCSIAVIGELDWSPKIHEQIIGRLDRDGQQNPVMAIYLVSDSGSDPLIVDLLGLKASQIEGVVNPLSVMQERHSDDSRIKLLAQRFLEKQNTLFDTLTKENAHERIF